MVYLNSIDRDFRKDSINLYLSCKTHLKHVVSDIIILLQAYGQATIVKERKASMIVKISLLLKYLVLWDLRSGVW